MSKKTKPALHPFLKEVRDLMKNQTLKWTSLDKYEPDAARELRDRKSITRERAAKLIHAIWELHERPDVTCSPPDKVQNFWDNLWQQLTKDNPLPSEADLDTFLRLFYARLGIGQESESAMDSGQQVAGNTQRRPLDLSDDELLEHFSPFLHGVVEDCWQLVTRGIKLGGDPKLRLAHVYVNLDTNTPRPSRSRETERLPSREDNLSALEALFDTKTQRVALVGEPGSGKSTFLQYVTLCLADRLSGAQGEDSHLAGLEVPELLRTQKALPLRILLRDFAGRLGASTSGTSEDVVKFLDGQLRERSHNIAADRLPEMLKRGLAFVLFDGLDEVPRSQVSAVRKAITTFAQGEYHKCRMAITCRSESYKKNEFKLASFPAPHEIAPLSVELRTKFVHAWYLELEQAQPQFRGEGGACAATLSTALASERLREMSANPFFLTAMAALHRPDKPLPDTGAELMDELVKSVLEEARKRRAEPDPKAVQPELASLLKSVPNGFDLLRSRLETIAYLARERRQDQGSRFVEEDLLRNRLVLAKELTAGWVDDLLEALRHRAGLLQSQDGKNFEFAYRFEEFLAGCYLTNEDAWGSVQPSFTRRVRDLLEKQGDYARLAIIWAAGFNVHVRHRKGPVRELVSAFVPSQTVADDRSLAGLELAADVAHDAGMENWLDEDVPDTSVTVRRLRARLEEVREGAGSFDPRTRSRAASAIGRLGDRRPGVDLRGGLPDIDWITIPAGVFKMGGKDQYQGRREFRCRLLEKLPYKISRYLITKAQYQAFVDDKGYEREFLGDAPEERDRIWTRAGWAWLKQHRILGPENYDAVCQTPNHPRVGVSWYEAAAFCRWLTRRLQSAPDGSSQAQKAGTGGKAGPSVQWLLAREAICLPSEAEWERAARGTQGRPYPWGTQADLAQRCNMARTSIGHTSAVGLFPSGDTLLETGQSKGVADMAGNVWEWCRTAWLTDYNDYERKVNDNMEGEDTRVLRGASWRNGGPDGLGSSSRLDDSPAGRRIDVGFRCVLVSVLVR